MKVYVVSSGNYYEGLVVNKATLSEATAAKMVAEYEKEFDISNRECRSHYGAEYTEIDLE